MTTEHKSSGGRHWLRWTVRIGLGLIILVCLGVALFWFYLERSAAEGKKQLAAAIAETDALDPRWRWEEIMEDRPPIPDAENSMRVIGQIVDSLQGDDPLPVILPDGEHVLDDYPPNRQLDRERLKLIQDILSKQQHGLELAITLKDLPRGRGVINVTPDFISTLHEHVHDCRPAFTLLELDAERLIDQRRPRDAVVRIRSILNAGAALRDEPLLISQLVRKDGRRAAVLRTERLLGRSEPGDDDLKDLIGHFRAEQDDMLLLCGLRGERAGYHFLFENLETDRLPLADSLFGRNPNLSHRFSASIYHPRLYDDHAFMLVAINEAFNIAQLPLSEQPQAWKDWDHRIRAAKAEAVVEKRKVLSFLLLPAFDMVAVGTLRDHTRLSCVLTGLAAERFRLAHKRWPKDLQELCPAYLKEVPTDPFDGKPLKLVQRGHGIIIYSVDKDGKDDGGDVHKKSTDDDLPKDLGIRLWNPDRRWLPPEAKKKETPKEDDDS